MKTIWALYDDGNCSYKKAIEQTCNGKYIVHCVGINDRPFEDTELYKYHKIDLSIFNTKLIEELEKLPKPDIILASPPCESWSLANPIHTYKEKSLELNDRQYFFNCNQNFDARSRRDFFKQQRTRLLGEATQMATIKIIEHFKPEKWVIENPQASKCWLYQSQFLKFNGWENIAYYNNYNDYPAKKPTIFKSNIELDLKHENKKCEIGLENLGDYDTRSVIPMDLIIDILNQLESPMEQQERLY